MRLGALAVAIVIGFDCLMMISKIIYFTRNQLTIFCVSTQQTDRSRSQTIAIHSFTMAEPTMEDIPQGDAPAPETLETVLDTPAAAAAVPSRQVSNISMPNKQTGIFGTVSK